MPNSWCIEAPENPRLSRMCHRHIFQLILAVMLFLMSLNLIVAVRYKRFVAFRKGSTFFYRLNYKVSTIPQSNIFAQASGFKVGWELPTHRSSRSVTLTEAREATELLYESHGLNGKMCLLKSLCQVAEYLRQKDGVLMKILNLISGSYNASTFGLDPILCEKYANHCPLHLIGFNGFNEM